MKKKILIPTDLSDNAWNAIAYSTRPLAEEDCEIYLLHAFADTVYNSESPDLTDFSAWKEEVAKDSETSLENILLPIHY